MISTPHCEWLKSGNELFEIKLEIDKKTGSEVDLVFTFLDLYGQ